MARAHDDPAPGTPPRLVVPAYFHPALHPGDWKWLASHPERVRLVILNVRNGPGAGPEAPFEGVTADLRAAGVPVIGYVDTGYGRRPAAQVTDEFGRYLGWYDVSGVCLDRAASDASALPYYAALSARLRELGARIIFLNHGAYPDEGYASHADLLGTFEGPWAAYRRLSVPPWAAAWPPERFYHVVYSVPPARFGEAARLAAQNRAAAMYITERGGANPYDRLPLDIRS